MMSGPGFLLAPVIVSSISFGQSPECLKGALRENVVPSVLQESKISRLDWYDMTCIVREAAKSNIRKWWIKPIKEVIAKFG